MKPKSPRTSELHRFFWLTIFAVTMAQLEAAVVVYLRQLYYPEGFHFPLVIIRNRIAVVEIGREVSTIFMLIAIARLTTADSWRRFGVFLYAFGIWDLFYYFWLWVMLGWPASLLDWDVLFLIPLPWTGPVLSAALIAVVMVAAGVGIDFLRRRQIPIRIHPAGWVITIAGACALLILFMANAGAVIDGEMPDPFPWTLYCSFLMPPVVVATVTYRNSLRGSQSS